MEIDRTKVNIMPLIRGPVWGLKNIPASVYRSVEGISLDYETEPEAIGLLLPEPYKPGKTPVVSVMFIEHNGVDFMAGNGYRVAVISVAAQFDGDSGHLEGGYVLVMPENHGFPIVTGRELLGMPKFFADITSIRTLENDHLRSEASIWGHTLFGLDLAPPLRNQNVFVRRVASSQATRAPGFGYKYIPALDGPPDADYPTIMWNDVHIEQLWLGRVGEFYVENTTERDVGDYAPAMQALRTLPVGKVLQTSHWRGSMVLRNDKNGRLR